MMRTLSRVFLAVTDDFHDQWSMIHCAGDLCWVSSQESNELTCFGNAPLIANPSRK